MDNNPDRHISELFTARYPGYDIFVIYEVEYLSNPLCRRFMERIQQYYPTVYFLPTDIIWSQIIHENTTEDNAPIYVLYYENERLRIENIHLMPQLTNFLYYVIRCCDRE